MDEIYFALILVGCTGFLSWSIAHSISKLTSALYDQSKKKDKVYKKLIDDDIEKRWKSFEKRWIAGLSDEEKLRFPQRGACWLDNKK